MATVMDTGMDTGKAMGMRRNKMTPKESLVVFYSIIMLMVISGCKQSSNSGVGHVDTDKVVTPKFIQPEIPAIITDPNLRLAYFIRHYWDHFDFADTTYVPTPEITEQAWVDYINYLLRIPMDKAYDEMKTMMSKCAQGSKKLFLYFTEMADKYLYDPNSPARNEELYIPVLEVMIHTPFLDDTEKIRPQYRLDWAYKNRIDTKAVNFQYARITGQTGSLYQINTEFIVLFFNNPECTTCRDHIDGMRNSVAMNRLLSQRRLTIISIYPDQDLEEWKSNHALYPSGWIVGYDPSFTIGEKYDLKATPTLYLLDRDKVVILKDAPLLWIENFLSRQ